MTEQYAKLAGITDRFVEDNLIESGVLSDRIAGHPELSNREFETSKALCRTLQEAGFQVERPYAGYETGFNAVYGHVPGSAKPVVIGLLAQYDALPEVGHGCGHNMCGPMSILAAGALKHALESGNISGIVRVIGTPAEETTGEKVPMAAAGLFDDCDFIMMAHPTSASTYVWFQSLAADPYEFTFTGKAAHAAAAPWEGLNALNGLHLFYHAIDMLRQHVRPEVRMHGIITEGGSAPNIVPSRATAHFLLRAPWRNYLNALEEQVFDCARGAALATGTKVEWKLFGNAMDNMLRNTIAEQALTGIMRDELDEPVNENPTLTGSTDMGAISWRIPTVELQIKVSDREIPPHTIEFGQASRGANALVPLGKAAKGLARMGLRVILDEGFRRSMHEEMLQRKGRLL